MDALQSGAGSSVICKVGDAPDKIGLKVTGYIVYSMSNLRSAKRASNHDGS
jgi:hypothetical protein